MSRWNDHDGSLSESLFHGLFFEMVSWDVRPWLTDGSVNLPKDSKGSVRSAERSSWFLALSFLVSLEASRCRRINPPPAITRLNESPSERAPPRWFSAWTMQIYDKRRDVVVENVAFCCRRCIIKQAKWLWWFDDFRGDVSMSEIELDCRLNNEVLTTFWSSV